MHRRIEHSSTISGWLMIAHALLLIIMGAGFVALTLTMARKPEVSVLLVLATEVITARYALPSIGLGSLTILAADLATPALLIATLLRPYFGFRRRQISTPLLAIFLLAVLGVVRGTRAFGLQMAGNGAREILGFSAAALFFSTVAITPDFVKALRKWFMVAATFITATGMYFWIQNGFGEFSSAGKRGLSGIDALLVLLAIILTITVPYGRTRAQNLIAPSIGFLVLVLSLQRSVAISGVVALIVVVLFGGRLRTRRSSRVTRVLLIAGGLAVALLVLAGPSGLTSDLSTAVETSTTQEGTFSWRLEGWQILIKDQFASPIRNILLGNPSGTGSSRMIGDTLVTVAPHSMYVSLFQEVGIIGLAIMFWLLVSMFRRNVVNVRSQFTFTATSGLLVTTMLAAQVTYFISYSAGLIAGLVVGLAASLAWFGAVDPEVEELKEKGSTTNRSSAGAFPRRDEAADIDQPILH